MGHNSLNFCLNNFSFCCEIKKCLYIKNRHFLFPRPISKMSRWFSIKQNAKKMRFLPFLATPWPLWKIFKEKFLAVKTKNVYISKTNIFCFHDPSPKCLGDFLLSKTRKNHVFLPFLATRWGRNHSKTPDSDSQRQITPI